MFSYRTHLKICFGLLAALIAVAAGGNLLAASGLVKDPETIQLPGLILVFGLFLAFGFSMIPVMVMSVLGAHRERLRYRPPATPPPGTRPSAAKREAHCISSKGEVGYPPLKTR